MLGTYFDIKIRPSVEKLEKTLGVRKQIEVIYIATDVCNPWESMDKCYAPGCNWFKHSQVGLQGGDYPPEYK